MTTDDFIPQRPKAQLLGPADADHYRVKVGRYGDRWYCDPLPADANWEATDAVWPSISSIKKASGSDWTFVGLLKRAAVALERRPEDLAGLSYSERYERLKTYNKVGLEAAAARGTKVHRWAEDLLNGRELYAGTVKGENEAIDDPYPYGDALMQWFDAYQPELYAAEIVCIHRDLNGVGYGGTCDCILKIDGSFYVVDWKSRGAESSHGAYPEEAAQVAAYANAQYWIVAIPDGLFEFGHIQRRAPMSDLGALIVSIRPDGCRTYPVEI